MESLEHLELQRLVSLGYVLPDKNPSSCLFTIPFSSESKIYFPDNAYYERNPDLGSYWIKLRSEIIAKELIKRNIKLIWEIGAGNGSVTIPMTSYGIRTIAVEPIRDGAICLEGNNIFTFHSNFESMSLPSDSINAIGLYDVLEHIEDSSSFLEEIIRALRPGGLLFLTVPAHPFLFSDYDQAIGHFRRYTIKSLDKELSGTGFMKIESRYFFSGLVLPAIFLRKIPHILGRNRIYSGRKGIQEYLDNQLSLPCFFEYLLLNYLRLETKLKIPFGLSILGIFQKK
jgi:SAM-dependent methyltransferase